ncbi:MAG TPA: SDR family oxidoreductase [Acidimicrobiales bacterium]|jgi:NAD(P)-dependent dehydrogenase (short-subunit alcohol dehydrogenase family)|nr:SDR family oxidoreductase [Acidimicrobiales bacterium]
MGVLSGKVAAVTGASSGSGRAIATRFAEEGASVYLLAREPKRLDELVASLPGDVQAVPCDVGDSESVAAAFARIGERHDKLHILVNNAAVYRPCPVEHLSDADIQQQLSTNLVGPVLTCRAAIPLLRAAEGADIVNTSSESTLHPFPMLSMYVATKAGLEAFSQVLAAELQDDDIRVTTLVQGVSIGPGGGSTDWQWDPERTSEAVNLWVERGLMATAGGRYGGQAVSDVAEAHVFIVTRPRTQKIDRIHVRSF